MWMNTGVEVTLETAHILYLKVTLDLHEAPDRCRSHIHTPELHSIAQALVPLGAVFFCEAAKLKKLL
jgi:hypothetical protein